MRKRNRYFFEFFFVEKKMWKFSEEMKPIYRDPNDSLPKGGKRHKYVLYVTKLPISNQYICSSKTENYIQPPKSDDVFI